MIEQTLLIIKPDAVDRRLVGEILHWVESCGFKILKRTRIKISKQKAQKLYEFHKGKDFYGRLVDCISSGESMVALLEREDAIDRLRVLILLIRNKWSVSQMRNSVHASDSLESFQHEVKIFF